jgi:hypothetical protein
MKRKMPLDGDQSFLLFFQMNDENIKNCWCEGGDECKYRYAKSSRTFLKKNSGLE